MPFLHQNECFWAAARFAMVNGKILHMKYSRNTVLGSFAVIVSAGLAGCAYRLPAPTLATVYRVRVVASSPGRYTLGLRVSDPHEYGLSRHAGCGSTSSRLKAHFASHPRDLAFHGRNRPFTDSSATAWT